MNYEVAENDIVARLSAWLVNKALDQFFVVSIMPETEADAKAFEASYPKGTVAVEYTDSNYMPSSGLGAVQQEEAVRFRLLFVAKKLRGNGGLFQFQMECKNALIGYRVPGSINALTVSGVGKQQFDDGVWIPYLEFECKTQNIQGWETDETLGGPYIGLTAVNTQFTTEYSTEFK